MGIVCLQILGFLVNLVWIIIIAVSLCLLTNPAHENYVLEHTFEANSFSLDVI